MRPFLSNQWWNYIQTYGNRSRHGYSKGYAYPKMTPQAARRDAWPPGGGLPASDLDFVRQQHLDFYGISAATVPSLSRFARLGRAKVVPVVTRLTPEGYDVQVLPAWENFPSDDVTADTALMNERLQGYIDTMPEQYYWVHKRFKTRPAGLPPVY